MVEYFASGRPATEGLPSVQAGAKAMGYSPDYLSDDPPKRSHTARPPPAREGTARVVKQR
jgi:hypothetical protein